MKNILFLAVLSLIAIVGNAQTGEISGKVINVNGDGIYPVSVTCTKNDSSVTMSVNGDKDGNYSMKPLPPGKYNVKVTASGYFPQTQQGLRVSADKSTFMDVKLKSDPAYVPVKGKKRKRSQN